MTCQTVNPSAVHQGQIVRLICVANFKVVNPNNDLTYILRSNNVYYRRVLTKISIFLRSIPMDNFNKAQEKVFRTFSTLPECVKINQL